MGGVPGVGSLLLELEIPENGIRPQKHMGERTAYCVTGGVGDWDVICTGRAVWRCPSVLCQGVFGR